VLGAYLKHRVDVGILILGEVGHDGTGGAPARSQRWGIRVAVDCADGSARLTQHANRDELLALSCVGDQRIDPHRFGRAATFGVTGSLMNITG